MPSAELVSFGQKFRRRMRVEALTAKLGDRDGDGAVVYVPGRPGWAYVREPQAGGFGAPVARRINGVIDPTRDRYVILAYAENNELVIQGRDFDATAASGGQPAIQPGDPNTSETGWLYQHKFATLLSHAYTTTSGGPSTDIGVRTWIHIRNGTLAAFPGARIDAASFVPSAGQHRVVCVFLKDDDTLELQGSTAKSMVDPLTFTDIQACITASTADSLPVWAWILKDAQSAITDADKWLDLRNLINDPLAGGGGSFAPDDAEYIVRVADAGLPNAQALGALSSGFMKSTTATGVVSTVADPLPIANGGTNRTSFPPGTILKKHLTNDFVFGVAGANVGDALIWDGNEWVATPQSIIVNQDISGSSTVTLNVSFAAWRLIEILIIARTTAAVGATEQRLSVNNDTTGANYNTMYQSGGGSPAVAGATSRGGVASIIHAFCPGASATSSIYNMTTIRIATPSAARKKFIQFALNYIDATNLFDIRGTGYHANESAISRFDLSLVAGNYDTHSRIVIRGVARV